MADNEEPKIFVDSDWKQEAQAEKERLAQAEKATESAQPKLPAPTLTELINLLASQAIMAMGQRDPQTGQVYIALEMAQFNIDMIGVLEEKTKGNLTDEEQTLLTQVLSELRLVYADTAKAVQQAMKEGKVAPVADTPSQEVKGTDG